MKVLFLTKYSSLAANTRYRCLQYLPFLQAAGIECDVSPLLNDDYLQHKFTRGDVKIRTVIKAYIQRLGMVWKARKYDAVVLHYELFPYFPAIFESLFELFDVKYICDYDDAIFHNYDNNTNPLVRFLLGNKISKVIRHSYGVLAGNQYLANYARRYSTQVSIIPTVVDLEKYARKGMERSSKRQRPFTIGWIGSPSTANYVKAKASALKRFCSQYDAQIILVGSGAVEIPGLPLIIREWSEESELEELAGFDVGIMPLSDDPWARGKCGFKLIQYMASGLPTVASPVGVNVELIEHGKSGFLAANDDEWVRALESLYKDVELRKAMGSRGFEIIKDKYSLSIFAPELVHVLSDLGSREKIRRTFSNVDLGVTKGFGDEWNYFQQEQLSDEQLQKIFQEYFDIFPWNRLPSDGGVGVDVGCGSGRWAKFIAPKVRELHCVEASDQALAVAMRALESHKNIRFHFASVGSLPFEDRSLDFAYCIGVLHHIPEPLAGVKEIARTLKRGAPFLFYIYYSFENRGPLYRTLWRVSDMGRFLISRLPFRLKYWVSQFLAAVVYWPLARIGGYLASWGILPESWTLSFYKDKPFYVMRTDALDRFGTRLEKRFSRAEIKEMLETSGFKDVQFSSAPPYWVGVAIKK